MNRHLKAPDPYAAIGSAVLAICGALGISERLGVTADQLAIVLGSIATIAATLRHMKRRSPAPAPAPTVTRAEAPARPSDVETADPEDNA